MSPNIVLNLNVECRSDHVNCLCVCVVPEDYDYNPLSGKRGDRTHHTELRHSSVEYIAPSEYMVSQLSCVKML